MTNVPVVTEGLGRPSVLSDVLKVLRACRGADRTVVVTVPVPERSPDHAFRAFAAALDTLGDLTLWDPPSGPAFVTAGATHRLEPAGRGRFRELGERAATLFSGLEIHGVDAPPPRLFGGFSFAPGAAGAALWTGFGDASFVLPTFSWGTDGGRAWLSVAAPASRLDADEEARLLDRLVRLEVALGAPERVISDRALRASPTVHEADRLSWGRRIDAIRDAIASGDLSKVVAARRTVVSARHPFEPARVLRRLGSTYAGCTRFAMSRGGATFLGATPERLVRKHGRTVETEALAGSIAGGSGSALLESDKDRREHDFVVRAILDRLRPLASSLDSRPSPELYELPNVVHLRTPVVAHLRVGVGALDVVEALHPTPAVGGVPRREALLWIEAKEGTPRGWYSAPVGFIDQKGDAELVVALRSGLLRGTEAHLWAGAGIVEGSEAEAEYAETALKLRPLLDALGGQPLLEGGRAPGHGALGVEASPP